MWAKAGFVIAVLLFGAAMFAAGTMAPSSVKKQTADTAAVIAKYLPLQKLIAGKNAGLSKNSPQSSGAGPAVPIDYTQLDLPDSPPKNATYALELDMVLSPSAVTDWTTRLQAQHYPAHVIDVLGPDGLHWTVVAAGTYKTPEAARNARPDLLQDVPKADQSSLRVILLPAPKQKQKPAAGVATADNSSKGASTAAM